MHCRKPPRDRDAWETETAHLPVVKQSTGRPGRPCRSLKCLEADIGNMASKFHIYYLLLIQVLVCKVHFEADIGNMASKFHIYYLLLIQVLVCKVHFKEFKTDA